jgi:hypothetical protein
VPVIRVTGARITFRNTFGKEPSMMRYNRYGIALSGVAVAMGMLSAACGNGAATASAARKATSCTVISKTEASAALGQAVSPPVMGKAYVEGGRACVFDGPSVPPGTSPDVPHADTVRVVLVTGPQAKKYFDNYRAKVNAQPISSLGDAAYYDGFASISVLKGDAYVRIAVGIANNLSAEKRLATQALTKM